jgi:hypothetical protein
MRDRYTPPEPSSVNGPVLTYGAWTDLDHCPCNISFQKSKLQRLRNTPLMLRSRTMTTLGFPTQTSPLVFQKKVTQANEE